MRKKYRSFNEARKFARSLKIKSRPGWDKIAAAGKLPEDIPKSPWAYYNRRGYWHSLGDFLGTGSVANQNRKFWSFTKARAYIRSLKLTSSIKWYGYCKSGKKPDNIPAVPRKSYKKEWVSMGDWLGTDTIAPQKRKFWSYNKASQYLIKHRITTRRKFEEIRKKGKLPKEIPTLPERTYRKQGKWRGYGHFFGTGEIASFNKKFRTFKDARKFACSLKLKNWNEWVQYAKSSKKPVDIPSNPLHNYRNKGWKSWGDFLGTGRVANQVKSKNWPSAKEARIAIKKIAKEVFGGKPFTPQDWVDAHKAGKIPANLPRYLQDIYNPDYRKRKKK